jgi:dUTP pyrophosphatase
MKKVLTQEGKTHYFYEKGDYVVDIKTSTTYKVDDIDSENAELIISDGTRIKLTPNIKPTYKTSKKAKIIDLNGAKKNTLKVNIKYFDKEMSKIEAIKCGDWHDLRCVGATKCIIHNNIIEEKGVKILSRNTIKMPIQLQDGKFPNEKTNELEDVKFFQYSKGDFLILDLGVAMQLPEGCEADVVPRGSTFKTYGIIETNSMGVIDNSYRGDGDKWFMPVLAMEDGFIIYNERVCQFKIVDKMKEIDFNEMDKFDAENRGGHGSTGTR